MLIASTAIVVGAGLYLVALWAFVRAVVRTELGRREYMIATPPTTPERSNDVFDRLFYTDLGGES